MTTTIEQARVVRATGAGAGILTNLVGVLEHTGQGVSPTLLAEQMAACGWPVTREHIQRWLRGRYPISETRAEQLAIAAGVDLAFVTDYQGRP